MSLRQTVFFHTGPRRPAKANVALFAMPGDRRDGGTTPIAALMDGRRPAVPEMNYATPDFSSYRCSCHDKQALPPSRCATRALRQASYENASGCRRRPLPQVAGSAYQPWKRSFEPQRVRML